ncbi:uncharacterized protein [Lepisosteus oculatus]|uniref:uncharacterized protein isoform X2 n=1 Tax=Lepisosteus oculatus TaxID=7918 RepID=UPI0007405297|nr:PREDICTED: uncharacterized protein LOC107077073 isoform X2 [Lepisosteus oculatus]
MAARLTGMNQRALLCSFLSLLSVTEGSGTVSVATNQSLVLGAENQWALLPAVYTVSGQPPPFLHFTWTASSAPVVLKTIRFADGQAREDPNKTYIPQSAYQGRVVFFSRNGSLLIRNLTANDTGPYTLTVKSSHGTVHAVSINLTVVRDAGVGVWNKLPAVLLKMMPWFQEVAGSLVSVRKILGSINYYKQMVQMGQMAYSHF